MMRLLSSLQFPRALLAAVFMAGAVSARAQDAAGEVPSGAGEVTEQEILTWVRQLDSNLFVQRELATERLIAAGAAAVDTLVQALATNNLEVTTRGVYILQELALHSDLDTSEAARVALEKVAAPRATSAARRATEALARLDLVRHERAMDDLKRLGAFVGQRQSQLGFQIVEESSVEIGEKWRGEPGDLLRLRWLRGVDEVVLNHPEVGDEALAHIAQMQSLPMLTIRKTRISSGGLRPLRELKGLHTLSILYCSIGDEAVESLAAIAGLAKLRLYGTQVTVQGKERLVQALPGQVVDVRPGGGFLGIGCDPTQAGCVIYTVRPNTAAEKAGLMVGDLIQKYEGKQVDSFEELTAAIAQNAPGDVISLDIVRGTEQMTKTLKLGGWEQVD